MSVDRAVIERFLGDLRTLETFPDTPAAARILDAFAAVPRERFTGPGPWTLLSFERGEMRRERTPDADPRHLYRPVLVALDEAQGINIGDPTLWAPLLARLDVSEGARVAQVGAGSGYYTAILAELVGTEGCVEAWEIEDALIAMAREALADRPNVALHDANAATLEGGAGPFDLVVSFAGVTHPALAWCEALAPSGRMLLPVTGSGGRGAMCLFTREGDGFSIDTWGPCGFYPCHGARDPHVEYAIDALFADRSLLQDARLRGAWEDGRFAYAVA